MKYWGHGLCYVGVDTGRRESIGDPGKDQALL